MKIVYTPPKLHIVKFPRIPSALYRYGTIVEKRGHYFRASSNNFDGGREWLHLGTDYDAVKAAWTPKVDE